MKSEENIDKTLCESNFHLKIDNSIFTRNLKIYVQYINSSISVKEIDYYLSIFNNNNLNTMFQ